MSEITAISLGWGVQSFGLVAMSALGVLPKVDFAIHADTGWERAETIKFAVRWTPWLEERGVRVVTVSADEHRRSPTYSVNVGSIFIPAFTVSLEDNSKGQLLRQCTSEWKILPVRRWLTQELERRGLKKTPGVVEQWIGFTLDEAHRAKGSYVKYIRNCHPFLEMLDRPYTRQMVIRWLERNSLEVPVKSTCVFCPFHNYHQWREIQLADNGGWKTAIEIDRAIRQKRPNYLCYVCDDRNPLEDHDFTRQMAMW